MIPTKEIPFHVANSRLTYNSDTGDILWKNGVLAGWTNKRGYVIIKLNGETYKAHRIAWVLYYKKQPNGLIDHIDGDKSNNKVLNLRDVSNAINCANRHGPNSTTVSGVLGVSYHKKTGKWAATMSVDGRQTHIGLYLTVSDAQVALFNYK